MDSRAHSLRWWLTKVVAGVLLIGLVAEHYLFGALPAIADLPILPGQIAVICGGLTTVVHYVYVWRRTRRLSEPDQLITEFGLYRYIRHPMYTGDLITYSGLLFLALSPVSVLVLCIGTYAIWRQSIVEDRYMAERFGASHRQWRNRTSLLIPGL